MLVDPLPELIKSEFLDVFIIPVFFCRSHTSSRWLMSTALDISVSSTHADKY